MNSSNNGDNKFVDYSFRKLFKMMTDKRISKKKLAEAAGVSYSSISRLSNNQLIQMDSLVSICRALDCGIDDIMEYREMEESDFV